MKTIEYRFVDKRGWARGEWDAEPDKIQWPDEDSGLPCLIRRGTSGALCGYVGVSPDHPWYDKGYSGHCTANPACAAEYCSHSPGGLVDVHGGLTFSDRCANGDPEHGICHLAEEGDFEPAWWFGFDCAHGGDLVPAYTGPRYAGMGVPDPSDTYRNVEYVQRQCAQLAQQLAAVKA